MLSLRAGVRIDEPRPCAEVAERVDRTALEVYRIERRGLLEEHPTTTPRALGMSRR